MASSASKEEVGGSRVGNGDDGITQSAAAAAAGSSTRPTRGTASKYDFVKVLCWVCSSE
jgi:hypothetical protein